MQMCLGNQLAVTGNQLFRRRRGVVRPQRRIEPADVIDADHHDRSRDAGLIEHVAAESGQRVITHLVAQKPCTRDTGIHYRDIMLA